MQAFDWDNLRIFNAVVDTGSLRGASLKLGVNHSTVFRRLQRLEESIGARLFDRLPEGYTLTAVGEELKLRSGRIGEEVDALRLRLQGEDFRPGGTIRVTAPSNIAYAYLPDYFESFRKLHPEISIELVVGDTSLDLTRREADVAVRATRKPPEYLIGRKVCSLAWSFYASSRYLKEVGRPNNQYELRTHRIVAGEGLMTSLVAMRWLESNCSESIVARCNTLNGMSNLAIAGYGIALLPDDQYKPELERLFMLEPMETTDLWILTHAELRKTERIRLLTNHMFDSLRADDRLRAIAVKN